VIPGPWNFLVDPVKIGENSLFFKKNRSGRKYFKNGQTPDERDPEILGKKSALISDKNNFLRQPQASQGRVKSVGPGNHYAAAG
jgi:hypothetical protein